MDLKERRARLSQESYVLSQAVGTKINQLFRSSPSEGFSQKEVKTLRALQRAQGRLLRRSARKCDDLEEKAQRYNRAAWSFVNARKLAASGRMRKQQAECYKRLMRGAQESGNAIATKNFAENYISSKETAKVLGFFKSNVKYPFLRAINALSES